ncbi:endolytic transglycosylase MltG [Arthrobacter sp. ISL-30]|uniref:endolytic transglycosylase MltG n=1 Tax=Arthrobacter sp. ISL-30 TaxID=2819109 RepID=UPI001BECB538|nr:endolytic transglycosylase MltG [Arthrobacter sp. ISL-30]MBT2512714.1 endolytic transglycosylase MltG [Arthrobacter sp. ISL-30]
MSPVNNGPSQDQDFSTGRIPLTRRELRERERFLATQNQDLVPPSAYAVADIDRETTAGSTGDSPMRVSGEEAASSRAGIQVETIEEMPVPEPEQPPMPPQPEASVQPETSALLETTAQPETTALPQTTALPAVNHLEAVADPQNHVADEHFEDGQNSAHDGGHIDDSGAGHHDFEAHDAHFDHDPHYDYDDAVHHNDGVHHYDAVHHDDEMHHDQAGNNDHLLAGDATAARSKKVRRRRRVVALLLTLVLFVGAIAVGAQFLKPLLGMDKLSDYPGPGTGSVMVSVQPGAGARDVATALEKQRIVANADTFMKELLAADGEISPGDFEFRTEMKNSDAVAVLLNRDASKVMYFALNAGLRIGESLETISKGSGIPLDQLKALSDSPAQFGVPDKAKNLEGFLAPGEYRFPLGTPAKDILQKLVTTTLDELKAQGITDPNKQYDAIIVASIVQAEGGQADYGNVAGAIYNRLKPGNTETAGLIQSDATVTYGLGRKSFHLEESEKADKSNPYNTYANPGLPVGPIGSPGKTAIDAAAKPTANDFMYWVTINLDTKETKFSKTLAEHNVYVEQYNQWCAANAGRCV